MPKSPTNFMRISSFICGNQGINSLDAFTANAERAVAQNGWSVYLLHGLDSDSGSYSPISEDLLQESVDYFAANLDMYWVDTFGAVVRYIRQHDEAVITELSASDREIVFAVSDSLEDTIYNVPLTLRRALPGGWSDVVVSQDGVVVESRKVRVNRADSIEFDVIPDGGEVVIAREGLPPATPSLQWEASDALSLKLSGTAGGRYALFESNDLSGWTPLETLTLEGDSSEIPLEAAETPRFFRAEVETEQ